MNHNFNEENKLEDFAFISNGNYFDIKTNLKSKPIFLSKKKNFFLLKIQVKIKKKMKILIPFLLLSKRIFSMN